GHRGCRRARAVLVGRAAADLLRLARADLEGALAQRTAAPHPRGSRGERAGEPFARRQYRRRIRGPLRSRRRQGLVVARRRRGDARARDDRRGRPRRGAGARRPAWPEAPARSRSRRARGPHRRTGRPARLRSEPSQAHGDVGRVSRARALRTRRAGVRRPAEGPTRRRPRPRSQGYRAQPRRGDRRGRPAGRCLMYALYTTIAMLGLLVLYVPLALVRRLTSGVPLNVRARLGYGAPRISGQRVGWLHAVSVGEAIAATPLVEGLRRLYPDLPLVVTTVTSTGAQIVRERFAGLATHRFFPLDLPWGARRVSASINPAFLICMETEFWPNTLRAVAARGVPVMIANGRISDRSYRRYRLVGGFLVRVLADVQVFAMQSDEDARRVIALGAPPERVVVTGNIKTDAAVVDTAGAVDLWRRLLGLTAARRVWIAGSTHPGEEDMVLEAHRAASVDCPELVLVLAPRHPERASEVQALLERRGWPAVRRSELPAARTRPPTAVP